MPITTPDIARTEEPGAYHATPDLGTTTRLDPSAPFQPPRFGLFIPSPPTDRPEVTSPEAAVAIFRPEFHGLDREACVALHLDTKHHLLGTQLLSLGSVDHTFMSPREMFRGALLANASAIVVAHNHPSGSPEPSEDDRAVTRRIVQAGEVVGVDLLDHLIFGRETWVSLARRGLV